MGWWKCSNKLYLTEPAISLSENRGRYAAGKIIRMYSFIRLLDFSSEDFCFASHEHFSKVTGNQIGQCQIVWDICIQYGVLRKTKGGYSAREWMQEQGLLSDTENNIQNNKTEKQKPKCQYEVKDQVRPNVRLSRNEIEELKKDYSDEQIARMLDKLSEYKTNTGRNYSSDYQAIRKWVYKTLDDSQKVQTRTAEVFEFPDWIFGIKEGENDQG